MKYFNHDTTASTDELIIGLRLTHGGAAVDAYWSILERIYEHEKPFLYKQGNMETISLLCFLAIDFETLDSWVQTMCASGLLIMTEKGLTSERAENNIKQYKARAKANKENGKKGGRKPKQNPIVTQLVSEKKPNGNPEETHSVSNGLAKKTQMVGKVKEKEKDMGFDKQNPISFCADAGAEKPAPRAKVVSGTEVEVIKRPTSKAEADATHQLELMRKMQSEAVSCPQDIFEKVMSHA